MTAPTQSEIRDAIKYFRQMCGAMEIENSNAFPEVQTIETILQSALDTQKPTVDAAEALAAHGSCMECGEERIDNLIEQAITTINKALGDKE